MRTARTGSSSAASSVVRANGVAALHDAETRKRGRADRRMRRLRRGRPARASARASAIVRQVADRVGAAPAVRRSGRAASAIRRSSASGRPARPPVNASARATSLVRRPLRPPLRERVHRPRRLLVRVAFVAGVGDARTRTVFSGAGRLDRVIADRRLDAQHRPRHVALDARTARRCRRGDACARSPRAPIALWQPVHSALLARRELRVLVDVGHVRVAMAAGAGGAAAQEALALPQPDRVV